MGRSFQTTTGRLLVILLPLIVGALSIWATGRYLANHARVLQSVRAAHEAASTGSAVADDRVDQRARLAWLDRNSLVGQSLALIAIVAAIWAGADRWYVGLPRPLILIRSLNLIVSLGALVISIIIT